MHSLDSTLTAARGAAHGPQQILQRLGVSDLMSLNIVPNYVIIVNVKKQQKGFKLMEYRECVHGSRRPIQSLGVRNMRSI